MSNVTKGISGHLTIIKKNKTGKSEVLLDDSNIIVSGMGVGLSYLFTGSGSDSILDYQIDRFQVGVSGPPAGGVTSSIYELSGALESSAYGADSSLHIVTKEQLKNGFASVSTEEAAALIPAHKISRIGPASVRYTLVLDDQACNGQTLNEIGMLMKNPTGHIDDRPILVCYRTYSDIPKTDDFSLVYRWVLTF